MIQGMSTSPPSLEAAAAVLVSSQKPKSGGVSPHGGSPWLSQPASRRSKVEDFSTARCDERDSEAARRAGVGYIHWGHLCQFETERLVAPDAARTAGLAPESFTGGR